VGFVVIVAAPGSSVVLDLDVQPVRVNVGGDGELAAWPA
jgi:hypothetical protein